MLMCWNVEKYMVSGANIECRGELVKQSLISGLKVQVLHQKLSHGSDQTYISIT